MKEADDMSKVDSISYSHVARRIRAYVTQADKRAFFSSILCSLFGYLYFGLNMLPNHDGILNFYFTDGATFTSGRWAQAALSSMSALYTPWLLVVVGYLAVAIATVYLVRIFRIQRFLPIFAVAAVLSLNPTMVSQVLYTYTLDGFFIAMLLCVLAVYFTERYRFGVWGGIILLAVAMGEYQAFLCYAIAIFAVRLLQRIMQNQMTNRELIGYVLKYAALLFGGLACYLMINRVVLGLLHLSMSGYQGMNKMGQISLIEILKGVRSAYRAFFPYFWELTREICGGFMAVLTVSALALSAAVSIGLLIIRKKRPLFQIVVALALLVGMPVLMNSIHLMGPQDVYLLMMYPLCFVYILGIVLAEELGLSQPGHGKDEKIPFRNARELTISLSTWAMLLCTVLISFAWGVVANECAAIVEAKNRNMYALSIRLVDRMEQVPGYDRAATPVVFAGEIVNNPNFAETKPYFRKNLVLVGWALPNDYTFLSDGGRLADYLVKFIGVNVNRDPFAGVNVYFDLDAVPEIRESDEYRQMPCFPAEGSLLMIHDILVVKLSMV